MVTTDLGVMLVVCNPRGDRVVISLTEKDNSVKIETFFKKQYYK